MAEAFLRGRCVLVTGADVGFGRALALALADAGADVAVAGSTAALQETTDTLLAMGNRAVGVELDLGSRDAVTRSFRSAEAALGQIDVVVHASFEPDALSECPLLEVDDLAWDQCCERVLRTAILVGQAGHALLKDRGGQIVFVTPTIALSGGRGRVPFSAAAAGVRLMAVAAARQWGPLGITVNCIAPDLDQMCSEAERPPRLFGAPVLADSDDVRRSVGPVVALLSSSSAGAVTGETIKVDGGSWFAG